MIGPRRWRAPLRYSLGVSPRYAMSCRALPKRVMSPNSACQPREQAADGGGGGHASRHCSKCSTISCATSFPRCWTPTTASRHVSGLPRKANRTGYRHRWAPSRWARRVHPRACEEPATVPSRRREAPDATVDRDGVRGKPRPRRAWAGTGSHPSLRCSYVPHEATPPALSLTGFFVRARSARTKPRASLPTPPKDLDVAGAAGCEPADGAAPAPPASWTGPPCLSGAAPPHHSNTLNRRGRGVPRDAGGFSGLVWGLPRRATG